MGKPRYNWWGFALNAIRDYPEYRRRLQELQQQTMVANNNGMPRAGGASRPTESVALRQLPAQEQREHDAVRAALARTARMNNGKIRQEIVKLTMWQGYTIEGAAMIVHVAPSTARRYRWQFVLLVGRTYGFMTEEEYQAAIKRDAIGAK